MKSKRWPYIGVFLIVVTLTLGFVQILSESNTEGAETAYRSVKIAPFMEMETGLYGYIDEAGSVVMLPKYQYAEAFSENLAVIAESRSSGIHYKYIDRHGKTIDNMEYDYARGFHEGLAIVSENQILKVINKKGEVSFQLPYGVTINDFSNGMAPIYKASSDVEMDVASGYVDRKGDLVFELDMIRGCPFSGNMAQVCIQSQDGELKWGYIDFDGNYVIEPKFIDCEPFTEDLAAVAIRNETGDKKWGYIDKNGDMVIEAVYDSAFSFSENLAVVYNENQGYGFIDRRGQFVIGPQYEYATSFKNGLATVREDSTLFKCIDKSGEAVIEAKNQFIMEFE